MTKPLTKSEVQQLLDMLTDVEAALEVAKDKLVAMSNRLAERVMPEDDPE